MERLRKVSAVRVLQEIANTLLNETITYLSKGASVTTGSLCKIPFFPKAVTQCIPSGYICRIKLHLQMQVRRTEHSAIQLTAFERRCSALSEYSMKTSSAFPSINIAVARTLEGAKREVNHK
jgi:hypothetical protein